MRNLIPTIVFCSLVGHALLLAAQENRVDNLSSLKPFINDQTVAVTVVDLDKIDISTALKDWIQPLALTEEQHRIYTAVIEQFDGWSKRLKSEGVSTLYIVTSIGQLPSPQVIRRSGQDFFAGLLANSTFAVVPGASEAAIEQFHNTLQLKAKETWPANDMKVWPDCRQIHGAAVVGMGTLLDQLNSLKPTDRTEFDKALAAVDHQPFRAAVVPPPIFAQAAGEILRDPAPGSDESLGRVISRGCQWLALGAEPNLEKFDARIVIQSNSADSARALAEAMKHAATDSTKQSGSSATAKALVGAAQMLSLLPEAKGDQVVLSIDSKQITVIRTLAVTALSQAAVATFHRESANNLKQIALAIMRYEDVHHEMPDRAIRDKNGRPLLSWRVALLPQFDEDKLYKEFHLDEPWDSEHNRQLIDRMPKEYQNPDPAARQPGRTRYSAVVGEHCVFPPDHAIKYKEITDGTSQTIMAVEAAPDHAVIWTKPDDLEVDLDHPTRGLIDGGQIFNGVFVDGHVEGLPVTINPKILRALFTRDGGEKIEPGSY